MPSSRPAIISPVLDLVQALNPKSALDVGIGFGKWGYLLREYMDAWFGRLKHDDWEAKIDGVEAYPGYISALQQHVYDRIFQMPIEFAMGVLDEDHWDLILMAEIIEHLSEEDGQKVLKWVWEHGRAIIITTPLYDSPQGEQYGNPYEEHKSLWPPEKLHAAIGAGQYTVIQDRYLIYWAVKDKK